MAIFLTGAVAGGWATSATKRERGHPPPRMHSILTVLLLLLLPAEGWSAIHYHWVQLIEGKQHKGRFLPKVSVRAIVDHKEECPDLYATTDLKKDKILFSMKKRHKQGALDKENRFAEIKVCEHTLQPDDKLLQTFTTGYLANGSKAIPVLLPDLSQGGVPLAQLITSGCSGCRDGKAQYCSEQAAREGKKGALPWLYGAMSGRAATEAGDGIPPLWIHLGDMRYSGQKEGVADSWQRSEGKLGWKEELFEPTATLLEKSWVVMMRGNHEGCFVPGNDWDKTDWKDRGEGWLYFFGSSEHSCSQLAKDRHDVLPAFAMDAVIHGGSVAKPQPTKQQARLMILDTARTGDGRDKAKEETRKLYTKQFDWVAEHLPPSGSSTWLFQHIPAYEWNTKKGEAEETIVTKAVKDSRLHGKWAQVAAVVSAHKHQFNLIRAHSQPTQITVGNGGVALSGPPGKSCEMAGKGDLLGTVAVGFGYLHARFAVAGEQVQATYTTPLFKPEWGPLQESQRVACTGTASQAWQPVCPKTTAQTGCAELASADED
ncbi:MAG: metallophosphoesterase [Magnetococcales bacterium]|nr:metallophosphoesterase [Magnetococcales bacterium]